MIPRKVIFRSVAASEISLFDFCRAPIAAQLDVLWHWRFTHHKRHMLAMINSHCPTQILLMRSDISGNRSRSVKPTLIIGSQPLHKSIILVLIHIFVPDYYGTSITSPRSIIPIFVIVLFCLILSSCSWNLVNGLQHSSLAMQRHYSVQRSFFSDTYSWTLYIAYSWLYNNSWWHPSNVLGQEDHCRCRQIIVFTHFPTWLYMCSVKQIQ